MVWETVRYEMRLAIGLLLLTTIDLDAHYCKEVGIGDSSDKGYCVMSTQATVREIRREWVWRERWRFLRLEPPPAAPVLHGGEIEWLGGLSPLGGSQAYSESHNDHDAKLEDEDRVRPTSGSGLGLTTAYGQWLDRRASSTPPSTRITSRPQLLPPEVELPGAVPPVAACWEKRSRYVTIVEALWKWPEEHINLKKARVALMIIRRSDFCTPEQASPGTQRQHGHSSSAGQGAIWNGIEGYLSSPSRSCVSVGGESAVEVALHRERTERGGLRLETTGRSEGRGTDVFDTATAWPGAHRSQHGSLVRAAAS